MSRLGYVFNKKNVGAILEKVSPNVVWKFFMKRPKQWFKKLQIILKKDFNNYGECCLTIFKKKSSGSNVAQ